MANYSCAQRLRGLMLLGAAVLPVSPAFAQEPAVQVETVVVNGTRPIAESEAAALFVQKNSDSLVAVAASDAVGRLPDQNIAQAAGRLPGLAVERDQGQARYISLRGAPNYWTTLSFDGINVVSPEGRDARFDTIPSAIASQIVVSKAVTPDMPGETVSGNVNIITRSALDYEGFHFSGKAGAGTATLGGRNSTELSAVASDTLVVGNGIIGALVSASYYQRNMITDNFEIDWERVDQDTRPGSETRFWAREFENKLYRLMRRNTSVSGRLDWQPNTDHSFSLRSLYTIFLDDEARDNYILDGDDRQGDLTRSTAACSTDINPTPVPFQGAHEVPGQDLLAHLVVVLRNGREREAGLSLGGRLVHLQRVEVAERIGHRHLAPERTVQREGRIVRRDANSRELVRSRQVDLLFFRDLGAIVELEASLEHRIGAQEVDFLRKGALRGIGGRGIDHAADVGI